VPRALQHPARLVPIAFAIAVAVGTLLLLLPISRRGPGGASPLVALFTSTSAISVTGMAVVDTGTYWSPFGHVVLLALVQVGGFGIMALATLLGLLTARRLGLRSQLVAQAETHTLALGDLRRLLVRVAVLTAAVEVVVGLTLAARFWWGYDYPVGKALWYGAFHAISSFNNAGFSLFSDNLVGFVGDWWLTLPVVIAVVAGSIGFPVVYELTRELRRPRTWSVHTRITVYGTAALLAIGFLVMLLVEWANPRTFGPLGVADKLVAALLQGASPRTAGFNSVDFGQMNGETLLVTDALMFIGGGSAGTAGGIKVTTFFLLAYVIWAEVRGERDVVVGRRRIAESTQRQAVAVALLAVAVVAAGTLALLSLTDHPFDRVLFEAISASATVGLSTGITPTLPGGAQIVLVILMYVGRVGTVTVASALALADRRRLYRYPEERPIVG
jgi:trk system potassium uptake protein TrkH